MARVTGLMNIRIYNWRENFDWLNDYCAQKNDFFTGSSIFGGRVGEDYKKMADKIQDTVNCYGAFKEYCCYNENSGLVKWRLHMATCKRILVLFFVSLF
jgi:hypothetical protein